MRKLFENRSNIIAEIWDEGKEDPITYQTEFLHEDGDYILIIGDKQYWFDGDFFDIAFSRVKAEKDEAKAKLGK
jgi:hypothetical protein